MKAKTFNPALKLLTLITFFLFSQNLKAQPPGCDACGAYNVNQGSNISPVIASTNSSTACTAITDFQGDVGCDMTDQFSAGCDGSGTNKGVVWVAFEVKSSNVTGGGMNFSPSFEGQYNYDNLAVTVYRGDVTTTTTGGGNCKSVTFTDSVNACSASTTDPTMSISLNGLDAGSPGVIPMTSGSSNWYFAKIYQRSWVAGDTPLYIRMCAWTYDAATVNPCTSTNDPTGTCNDLTPNKDWGTKSCPTNATNDITADWCFATGQTGGGAGCSNLSSSDIKCTSGNSSSTWSTFEYNGGGATGVSAYGFVEGFNISASGSGIGGADIYAQVYTFADPACPVGSCFSVKGSSFDMNLGSIGLTNGTKYYMRVWAGGVATTAVVSSFTAKCALGDLVNDKYSDATAVCSDHSGVTTNLHVTSNGATCAKDATDVGDCGFSGGCGALVKFLSSTGGCSNNTNTNDTWFKFCAKTSGKATMAVPSMACAGTTGTQFWLMGEGTNGKAFCDADHFVEGAAWDDFATPSDCSSTGTTASFSMTEDLVAGKCYYMITDGYRSDYCDYNLNVTCACAITTEACLADVTAPTIVNTVATNVAMGSTFDLTLSEAVRCCYINSSDFLLSKATSACAITGYSVTDADGIGCASDGCSDTTRTIRVTISPTISSAAGATNGCTYDNLWDIIVNTASVDIYDRCVNLLPADAAVVILPLELISFTGRFIESSEEVVLDWKTASERNIQSYSIEHSSDGKQWTDIGGRVPAAGNSTTIRSYTLTDTKPFYPISYYRLIASFVSGNNSPAGDIIFVKTKSGFKLNSIHPIPANDVIIVDFMSGPNDKLEVKIYDVVGKQLFSEKLYSKEGGNIERVDISSLSKGAYIITIMNDGHSVHQQKIVKY